MRVRDRLRIELAVQRVGWWLDWKRMRGRRRREVLRELRANLADAAIAGELDEALARFGEPRAMAHSYLEGDRTGGRWRAGVLAAAAAYVLVTWLLFAGAIGFAEGIQAVGPEVGADYETGHSLAIGDNPLLSFRHSEEGFSFGLPFVSWPHLAVMGVAFLLFSRPWQLARPGQRGGIDSRLGRSASDRNTP